MLGKYKSCIRKQLFFQKNEKIEIEWGEEWGCRVKKWGASVKEL